MSLWDLLPPELRVIIHGYSARRCASCKMRQYSTVACRICGSHRCRQCQMLSCEGCGSTRQTGCNSCFPVLFSCVDCYRFLCDNCLYKCIKKSGSPLSCYCYRYCPGKKCGACRRHCELICRRCHVKNYAVASFERAVDDVDNMFFFQCFSRGGMTFY